MLFLGVHIPGGQAEGRRRGLLLHIRGARYWEDCHGDGGHALLAGGHSYLTEVQHLKYLCFRSHLMSIQTSTSIL